MKDVDGLRNEEKSRHPNLSLLITPKQTDTRHTASKYSFPKRYIPAKTGEDLCYRHEKSIQESIKKSLLATLGGHHSNYQAPLCGSREGSHTNSPAVFL